MPVTALVVGLVIGLLAGVIAWRLVSPNRPVWRSLIAGVLGSIIGAVISAFSGAAIPIEPEIVKHAILSVAGAVVIVLVAKVVA